MPISHFLPRKLSPWGVTDPRGNLLDSETIPVQTSASEGIAIAGRVVRADGSAADGVPVTLTYYEEAGLFCDLVKVRPTQVTTDEEGRFSMDFVMAGPPYSLSATDTAGLSDEAIAIILQSAEDDAANREKLLELASQPNVQNTLLEAFSVGALPDAVALAQGLDRAFLREVIEIGSSRIGSESPVALRFRGRGTVVGTVYQANGETVVLGAGVNLFPDPGSREKGRGVLSGSDGTFSFFGVPLGTISLQATAPDGTTRTVSETLTGPGEILQLDVILSAAAVAETSLAGRVFEADGVTPHGGAQVFVGKYIQGEFRNVVALADASAGDVEGTIEDETGLWTAQRVPEGIWDLVAVSADGRRKGERRDTPAVAGSTTQVNLILQSTSVVTGRVEFADGTPAVNAIVAGGRDLVRTDALGAFTIEGVPTGRQRLSAGLERDETEGIFFPRIGGTTINVVAGSAGNFAVIRFEPKASITGRVLNVEGNPVPGVTVSIPQDIISFIYTPTDENGVFVFENLALREWTLSAPGPPVSGSAEDLAAAESTILGAASGEEVSQEDLLGAITDAFAAFTGVNDPLITGEGENFNPLTWGFEKVNLTFDGQVANVDIIFLPEGTISGTVKNGQGVPIGARVRLTGIGPLNNGDVGFIIRGERNSDPALGTFEFPGQALAGPFGLQASSPFFPVVITHEGATSRLEPNASDILLQFPAEQVTNGRLVGQVLNPDGTPAGADVDVKISFGDNFIIRTDDNGAFDTQIDLPALDIQGRPGKRYSVEAEDPATGLRGTANLTVFPEIVNEVTVQLLGKGDLEVLVTEADGTPVAGADVTVMGVRFPRDNFDLPTDGLGVATLNSLFEGPYSIRASTVIGPTTIRGSTSAVVTIGQTAMATVMLQPTGSIRGRFVENDGVTPVPFAQITIGGGIGFASTDLNGDFEVVGLPLGNYRLIANEPVSGQLATANAIINFDGQIVDTLLIVRSLGEVTGSVLNSTRDGFVAGAVVTLRALDGLTETRTVTAGPDGSFAFSGVVEGVIRLTARHPVSGITGSANATMEPGQQLLEVDIPLSALGEFTLKVYEPDGVTPADATVSIGGIVGDTDVEGMIRFADLALKTYTVTAQSRVPASDRSAQKILVTLSSPGINPAAEMSLLGIGSIEGTVFDSDGLTPLEGVTVSLRSESEILPTETRSVITDSGGGYAFANLAVGTYRLTATSVALGATFNGSIDADGEVDFVDLTLGASGTVRGRLLRADQISPVEGIEVVLFFESQSGLLGVASDVSDENGNFEMTGIPIGEFDLEAISPEFNGIVRLSDQLTVNGEERDFGDLPLDEDDLSIVEVSPVDTAVDAPIATDVLFTFNEAVDENSFDEAGIYICDDVNLVPASLSVVEDGLGVPRIVRLSPDQPLESETTYHTVVLDGDRLSAGSGQIIAKGPRDLVGRPLVVPFQSSFTTADQRPPELLSLTPEDGAINLDVRSVVRLSFDEPIDPIGITIDLTGPAGPVSGNVDVGVNGQVVVFTPTFELEPNAIYTATAQGFQDIAGNAALDQPFTTTFGTLDTIGPTIAELRIKDGAAPVANAEIELEAVLAAPDPGARVRMTADLVSIGETVISGDLDLPYTLPEGGSITFRAIAIDLFGNEGPLAELIVAVVENVPPTIELIRISPASGPVPTGSPFSLKVRAADDGGISELRAAVGGAATIPLRTTTSSDEIDLVGVLPSQAMFGESIEVFAEAIDTSGESSGEQQFIVEISDATPPTVAITAPGPGSDFPAAGTVTVEVDANDNFGVSQIDYTVTGAFAANGSVGVTPQSGSQIVPVEIPIPGGTPEDGSAFTVDVTGMDDAGLTSGPDQREFRMVDLIPPSLLSVTPVDGATNSSLWREIRVEFDESLDPATVTADNVTLINGGPVAGSVELFSDDSIIVFFPEEPFTPETTYTFNLNDSIIGADGNAVPPLQSAFTVTDFGIIQPADGSQVVEGQTIAFQGGGTNPDGVREVIFSTDGLDLGTGALPDLAIDVVIPLLSELGDPPHQFGASAQLLGGTVSGSETFLTSAPANMTAFRGQVGHSFLFELAGSSAGTIWGTDIYTDDSGLAKAAVHAGALRPSETGLVKVTVLGSLSSYQGTTRNGVTSLGFGSWPGSYQFEPGILRTLDLNPITLDVRPSSEDTDNDGIDNGTEVQFGLDPFRDDTAEDPDGDNPPMPRKWGWGPIPLTMIPTGTG